jgi:polysaccharide export outer membrane protein
MRSKLLHILAAFSVVLSGCSTVALKGSAEANASLADSYRLGAGDKFRLIVYGETALSGQEFLVNSEGDASLPLVGPVRVAGLSTREAEQAIAARYASGFIVNPKVNIDITMFRPFYILGEVNKPGQYPYVPGMTVLNAVALAEGFTFRASQRKVFIRRSGSTAEEVVELGANTPVMPGDTVRVVERFF